MYRARSYSWTGTTCALRHTDGELSNCICCGRVARARFLRRLLRCLWWGDVTAAPRVLDAERLRAQNDTIVTTRDDDPQARQPYNRTSESVAGRVRTSAADTWRKPPICW